MQKNFAAYLEELIQKTKFLNIDEKFSNNYYFKTGIPVLEGNIIIKLL